MITQLPSPMDPDREMRLAESIVRLHKLTGWGYEDIALYMKIQRAYVRGVMFPKKGSN